jgi:hypothetical protein
VLYSAEINLFGDELNIQNEEFRIKKNKHPILQHKICDRPVKPFEQSAAGLP